MSAMIGNVHGVLRPATGRRGGPTRWHGLVAGLVLLALAVLLAPRPAVAQQPGKVARVGFLGITAPDCAAPSPTCKPMAQGLRDLGYVEGENLVIEFRTAEGQLERLPTLAAELVQRKVDVLVAGGPEVILRAARQATSTLPIVMVAVDYDPMALGYIAGLPRPGGNITGLFLQQIEVTGKCLELLKDALPQITRVAVLWDAVSADSSARRQGWHRCSGCGSNRLSCATRRPTITTAPWRPQSGKALKPCWSCGLRCSVPAATVSSLWRRSTGCPSCPVC